MFFVAHVSFASVSHFFDLFLLRVVGSPCGQPTRHHTPHHTIGLYAPILLLSFGMELLEPLLIGRVRHGQVHGEIQVRQAQ